MHPPEIERPRGGGPFDPIAEAARYPLLSRELVLEIWERVAAEATDSAGRLDADRAQGRFHEVAASLAARGGRLQPDVGRRTRVEVELDGASVAAWPRDLQVRRSPGREKLFAAEARRWTASHGEPAPEVRRADGSRELPGAGELERALAALQQPMP